MCVCVYMQRERERFPYTKMIYYKELADAVMEADQTQNCRVSQKAQDQEAQNTRRTDVGLHSWSEDMRPRDPKETQRLHTQKDLMCQFKSKGRKKFTSQNEDSHARGIPSHSREGWPFCPSQAIS